MPGSPQGHAYTWTDAAVEPGATYWYWLEDVDLSGATTLHGPISATVAESTAVRLVGLRGAPFGGTAKAVPFAVAALVISSVVATLVVLVSLTARIRKRT